jgi:hypothetical protein
VDQVAPMHPNGRPARRISWNTDVGHGASIKGGRKMERMSDYEWFCANCLRMVETLSRHGRCPYCDSNAVDVAYRSRRLEMGRDVQVVGSMATELFGAHQ